MKIIPLGGETLGVRSMATFVETEDVCILIDPGLSVVSIIHSLPPTPFELRALSNVKENIRKASKRAHVVIITHYHNDHFSMDPSLYRGKEVFIKDPENFISNNQKRRARKLLKSISSIANIHYAAGEFKFGNTEIIFSPIFTHGISKKMGGVVSILIKENIKFLYSSDVQGFPEEEQIEFLVEMSTDVVFFDGPTEETLPLSVVNLSRIIHKFKETVWVMEHHPFRFLDWRERFYPVVSVFEENGIILKNFASYLLLEEMLFEAERNLFYERIKEFNRKIW